MPADANDILVEVRQLAAEITLDRAAAVEDRHTLQKIDRACAAIEADQHALRRELDHGRDRMSRIDEDIERTEDRLRKEIRLSEIRARQAARRPAAAAGTVSAGAVTALVALVRQWFSGPS